MFKQLTGDTVLLRRKGGYRVCDLYEWDGKLFAKLGAEYIRLNANGTSSKDGVAIEHLITEAPLLSDRFGRLAITSGEGRIALPATSEAQLKLGKAE